MSPLMLPSPVADASSSQLHQQQQQRIDRSGGVTHMSAAGHLPRSPRVSRSDAKDSWQALFEVCYVTQLLLPSLVCRNFLPQLQVKS